MRKLALRYGLRASVLLLALSALHFFILPNWVDYSIQEAIGYLTMLLSMIFVFLGIRQYRDRHLGGYLRFGQGLKLGTLIALLPSVLFGLFDVLYTRVINPDWAKEYTAQMLEEIRRNNAADQAAAKEAELRKTMDLFANPLVEFGLMAVTVFVIGFIVAIIASLALRRKPQTALAL